MDQALRSGDPRRVREAARQVVRLCSELYPLLVRAPPKVLREAEHLVDESRAASSLQGASLRACWAAAGRPGYPPELVTAAAVRHTRRFPPGSPVYAADPGMVTLLPAADASRLAEACGDRLAEQPFVRTMTRERYSLLRCPCANFVRSAAARRDTATLLAEDPAMLAYVERELHEDAAVRAALDRAARRVPQLRRWLIRQLGAP